VRSLRSILVPREVVLKTLDALQEGGEAGLEALVLWLAHFDGQGAEVTDVWQPKQDSTRTKDGLHLRVGGAELARLNEDLYRTGRGLLAQVHSHPGLAYHSELDDAKPIVTEQGTFSIVVPFFGFISLHDLTACAVFRIEDGLFVPVPPSESARLFVLPG